MDIKQFNEEYREYVIKWIHIKNVAWNKGFDTFFIDAEEFYSEVLHHLFVKTTRSGQKKIDQFNEKYVSIDKDSIEFPTTFEAWLSMVLLRLHVDLYRKTRITKTVTEIIDGEEKRQKIRIKRDLSLDQLQDESGDFYHPEIVDDLDETIDTSKCMQDVYESIESITKVNHRVLIKLKLYIEDETKFNDDELTFMMKNSKLTKKEVEKYIHKNKKEYSITGGEYRSFGMKNENITFLTGFAEGSISTMYDRIVRKLNIQPYKE